MRRLRPSLLGAALLALPVASPSWAGELALKRVLLSTGGVGYFEYAAEVDGPATLGLDVPLAQVDDVLISLVVFDDAGSVGGVELPGQSGSGAAFGNVPFAPDALNSALDYLNSLQGIEIAVQGPRPMTGRLLHVEQVSERGSTPEATVARTRVSVLTQAGLQQFVLEEAEAVQVAEPELRDRILRALATLQHSAANDVRHLAIRSNGTGHRTVTVGYVAGAPLWKTSYRLALPQAGGRARLQGWAVLENDLAADWNGVTLTLQSGNPVTFRQAIYRSYYVDRPTVPVEVLGRILPDVDTASVPADALRSQLEKMQTGSRLRGMEPVQPPAGAAAPAPAPPPAMAAPAESAQVAEGAEQTEFTLPSPVVLAAGHTASVPILDREVPAERIGLVQQGRPHPLAAVRLTNDSGVSLPAGVLTLYDLDPALAFAGDARLGGLPARQTRLLSFAEDLRTEVAWQTTQATSIASLTAAGGVLHLEERLRSLHRIRLTAPPGEARSLLVEIARPANAALAPLSSPPAAEETATAWRIAVALQAGETRELTLAVDRQQRQQTSLTENAPVLARILGEEGLSDPARAALRHIAELRQAEAAAVAARDALRGRQDAVAADEDRLRKNLAAVPATDALHGRLVRQLDTDETQLASLAGALADAETAIAQARKALQDGIAGLRIG